MTQQFASFEEFAQHLSKVVGRVNPERRTALRAIGAVVTATAKEKIGEYQPEVSAPGADFLAWPALAEATVEDRVRQGFTPNDPLLRTGDMRDTILAVVEGDKVAVGSVDPIADYQERGTASIPPRPFLGPAMAEHLEDAEKRLKTAVERAFEGR